MSDEWVPVAKASAGTKRRAAAAPVATAQPAAAAPLPITATTFRPSILAAMQVPINVFVFLTFLFLPFFVGTAVVTRDPLNLVLPGILVSAFNFFPALFAVFAPAFQILFTRYTIDEEGIRVGVQFLSKRENKVPWRKITAIAHRRSFVDRIFRIERLDIIAYGARGTTLRLVGLRNAAQIRNLVAIKMRQHATVEALFSND